MKFFETTITEEAKQKVMGCLNSGFIGENGLVEELDNKLFEERKAQGFPKTWKPII